MGLLDSILNPNSSVGDIIKRADKMPDAPEHTLAYYDNNSEDLYSTLSNRQKRMIKEWMSWSKNLSPREEEITLSAWQKLLVGRWMRKSEHLSVDSNSGSSCGFFHNIYNKLCINKYENDLRRYMIRERETKLRRKALDK